MRFRTFAVLAALVTSSPALAGLTQVSSFGSNPGGLLMYEYVPQNLPGGRPLVVVLHGCTQSAASMVSAGWNTLADQYQFAVLYPQQTSSNNPVECFNWAGNYGNPADLERGMGENESIIEMIDTEITTHHVDTHQVYVVGFSAGAAFTAVMMATWPERIAAAAIMSGLPYDCATTVNGAFSCQNPGVSKTAAQWGDLVRAAVTGYSGAYPRVQIWHGTSDTTVAPMNQAELMKQWTNVSGTDQTADETEMIGSGVARSAFKVGSKVVVETYTVSGMSHAVAIGAEGSTACPATAGAYFEDHKICSTLRAAKFFGVVPGGSGGSGSGVGSGSGGVVTGVPYVSIVAPSNGDTVTGQVTIVIAAGDDAGIAKVELAIDGTSKGSDDTAPYQFDWNASEMTPGPHQLVATATDTAGHIATAMATVTIAGPGGGSGGSDPGTGQGGVGDLPSCALSAGGGGHGWAPIAMAVVVVVRVRRRRRR